MKKLNYEEWLCLLSVSTKKALGDKIKEQYDEYVVQFDEIEKHVSENGFSKCHCNHCIEAIDEYEGFKKYDMFEYKGHAIYIEQFYPLGNCRDIFYNDKDGFDGWITIEEARLKFKPLNRTVFDKKITIFKVEEKGKEGRLNIYNIKYLTKSGVQRVWNIFSRKNKDDFEEILMDKSKMRADGVAVCATHEETGRLVVLHEYRVGVNRHLITLPGGIVDGDETYAETGIREFKEETNMEIIWVDKTKGLRPRYSAVGLTDETVALVYGICSGASTDMQGDNEEGKVLLLSPEEAKAILASPDYELAGRTELILENYILRANPIWKYVDYETAMNSGKKIKPRTANITFLTPEDMEEWLSGINEFIRNSYIEDDWQIEDTVKWVID
jgi:ADP-ribose pyrophosphatase